MSWTLMVVLWGVFTVGVLFGGLLCSSSRRDQDVRMALQEAALREHHIDQWWEE